MVFGTLFPRIKLIEFYQEKKFHIQNYDGLENLENRSRALNVLATLGSSTDTNLGHNHAKILKNVKVKFRYFRIAFSREVVDP